MREIYAKSKEGCAENWEGCILISRRIYPKLSRIYPDSGKKNISRFWEGFEKIFEMPGKFKISLESFLLGFLSVFGLLSLFLYPNLYPDSGKGSFKQKRGLKN